MAKRKALQGDTSPSKSKSIGWRGYRHFSCKHYKLVAAKFPFLDATQIRSRVKRLWNKLPTEKKIDYAYSPEKIRSPSPKKFLRLSPDLYSWSPSKPYTRPTTSSSSVSGLQQVDSRPLKSSWQMYLDTSHSRDAHQQEKTGGGGGETSSPSMQGRQHTGILVRHSQDKPSKPKTKKGRVTFELFPRRELFATDGAPTDISSQEVKQGGNSIDKMPNPSVPCLRRDSFATSIASRRVSQELDRNDIGSENVTITSVRRDLFATGGASDGVSQKLKENDVRSDNAAPLGTCVKVQHVDGMLVEMGSIGAEISIGSSDEHLDVMHFVNGVVDDKSMEDVICEETGEVEIAKAGSQGKRKDHEDGEMKREGKDNESKENDEGNYGMSRGVDPSLDGHRIEEQQGEGFAQTKISKHGGMQERVMREIPDGVNDLNEGDFVKSTGQGTPTSSNKEATDDLHQSEVDQSSNLDRSGSGSEVLTQLEGGISQRDNFVGSGSVSDGQTLLEGGRQQQKDTTSSEKPSQSVEERRSSSVDEQDDERHVVAEILAELGIIIAQEVSPRCKHKEISKLGDDSSSTATDTNMSLKTTGNVDENNNVSAKYSGEVTSDDNIVVMNASAPVSAKINESDPVPTIMNGSNPDATIMNESDPGPAKSDLVAAVMNESNPGQANMNESDPVSESTSPVSEDNKQLEPKRKRGRPPKYKLDKTKVHYGKSACANPDQKTTTLEAAETKEKDAIMSSSPQKQNKHCRFGRSPRNLRRSPRLANLQVIYSPPVIRKSLSKRSPKKHNKMTHKLPQTPPPEPDMFSSPQFNVYEFKDETEQRPEFKSASPLKRLRSPGMESIIVPQCVDSDDDCGRDGDVAESTAQAISSTGLGWVDGTAKRLINKGMLNKKGKAKRAAEEYNLDSEKNAGEFADETRSHKTPTKRKRRSKCPVSIKLAKKSKRDMLRKDTKKSLDSQKRKKTKSKKQLIPPASPSDDSTPMNGDKELMQAISSLDMETNLIGHFSPDSPEPLLEPQSDFLGEDYFSSPVSLINDSCDNWMYHEYSNSDLDSSDSEDRFISFRKKPTGGIRGPMICSDSQSVCQKFTEFCANLSQNSSGSSIRISDIEEDPMDPTLNAVSLSPLYSMEDSQECEAELADIDTSHILSDVDDDEPESAALATISNVLSSALDCLENEFDKEQEDMNDAIQQHNQLYDAKDQPCQTDDLLREQEDEENEELMTEPQQSEDDNHVHVIGPASSKLNQVERSDRDVADREQNEQDNLSEECDKTREEAPTGKDLNNNDKMKALKEDKELGDIIDQALRISGITEDTEYVHNNNKPSEAVINEPQIFLQDTETNNSQASNDVGREVDGEENEDLLCNLFHQISPSPPRASHIPTPRASGRRLLASNRVETVNNFSQLFEDDGIFL